MTLESKGVQQAYLRTLMPVDIPRTYRTRVGLCLGVACLGQYLFEELREKRGLVYGANASLYWELPGQMFLSCSTATEHERLEKTQRAFRAALNRFSEEGLSAERINNMKRGEAFATIGEQENIDTSAGCMWEAYEEDQIDMDPYKKHLRTLGRLSVESIRSTTRLHLLGKDKLGKLVGS